MRPGVPDQRVSIVLLCQGGTTVAAGPIFRRRPVSRAFIRAGSGRHRRATYRLQLSKVSRQHPRSLEGPLPGPGFLIRETLQLRQASCPESGSSLHQVRVPGGCIPDAGYSWRDRGKPHRQENRLADRLSGDYPLAESDGQAICANKPSSHLAYRKPIVPRHESTFRQLSRGAASVNVIHV